MGDAGFQPKQAGLIAGLILCIGLSFGVSSPAMAAQPDRSVAYAASLPSSPEMGVLAAWQYNYYQSYFTSEAMCNARGNWMQANIDEVLTWHCHRHAGDHRWLMDVYWAT